MNYEDTRFQIYWAWQYSKKHGFINRAKELKEQFRLFVIGY